MIDFETLDPESVDSSLPGLANVMAMVGKQDFRMGMVNYLHHTCGADHYAIFQLGEEQPAEILSVSLDGSDTAHRQVSLYMREQHWQRDPSILEARKRFGEPAINLLRTEISDLQDARLRDNIYGSTHIRERILLCGGILTPRVGLSILRSDRSGPFSSAGLDHLRHTGTLLLSIVEAHARTTFWTSPARALTSLVEVERALGLSPQHFSKREGQVIARVLYGMSTAGIASDLGIGEETVMTYRKRAYQNLGIATQRELLLWYLDDWDNTRRTKAGFAPLAPSAAPSLH